MKTNRTLTALALGLTTIGAGAGAASAAPLDHFTFHEELTDFRTCDNGLGLRVDTVNDGKVVVVQHGTGDWGYALEHWDRTFTVTNLANGQSYTGLNKGLALKDQKLVDNGDGTQTLTMLSPAQLVVWGLDGKVIQRSAGTDLYEFLVSGDDLEFVGVLASHGLRTTTSTCETAATLWP